MALFQRQNVVLRSPDLLFLLIIENKSLQFNKDDWTLSLSKSGVFFPPMQRHYECAQVFVESYVNKVVNLFLW